MTQDTTPTKKPCCPLEGSEYQDLCIAKFSDMRDHPPELCEHYYTCTEVRKNIDTKTTETKTK